MNTTALFEQLIAGHPLAVQQMQDFMQACMTGALQDGQITAFLALMRAKGETVEELTAAAQVMMAHAYRLDLGQDLLDIVGTGGDGRNTFNISTASSFVAAAAGARIAKHGNRAVSSRSGSADLLTEAGFALQLNDQQLKNCMEQQGLCFLFAPHFHQAMQHVRQARQQLGIRSLFNLLGPLVNPASVKQQVVGVFATGLLQPIAQVLANLGVERALVVHSQDGLDEISISAITDVVEYHQGQFKQWTIDPKEYHCYHTNLDEITVQSASDSLKLIHEVLNGQLGAARDIVLLNSGAALYCCAKANSLAEGIQLAALAIDQGQALACFNQLRDLTHV